MSFYKDYYDFRSIIERIVDDYCNKNENVVQPSDQKELWRLYNKTQAGIKKRLEDQSQMSIISNNISFLATQRLGTFGDEQMNVFAENILKVLVQAKL